MSRPLSTGRASRVVDLVDDALDRVDESDARGWLFDITLEDTETEPVPTGCPQCWLTGGGKCSKCPLLRDRNASTPDAVLGC